MDNYYASNGYFAFSATRKEMSEKDVVFDRVQTFLDERLLEITSLISVKNKLDNLKSENIEKLSCLNEDIGIKF